MPLDVPPRCGLLIATTCAAVCLPVACARREIDASPVARLAEPVIYGADDRVEPQALSSLSWAAGATVRSVALVPAASAPFLDSAGEDAGDTGPLAQSARERLMLCPDERFGDQPSLADCSGVLVAADIVLTAGHCFSAEDDCTRYHYALSYTQQADEADSGAPVLTECRELLIREVGELSDGSPIDYALIRLATPVDSIVASQVSRDDAVQPDSVVATVGFPEGLPLKIDPNGKVLAVDRTGFHLLADTYHGSSGSGIYDEERLVGVLTSGQSDFVWDLTGSCWRSRVVSPADAGTAERGMHAWLALARACFRQPELELCPLVPDGAAHDAATADEQSIEEPMVVSEAMRPTAMTDDGSAVAGSAAHDDAAKNVSPVRDGGMQDPAPGRAALSASADAAASEEQHVSDSGGCSASPRPKSAASPVLLLLLALLRIVRLPRRSKGAWNSFPFRGSDHHELHERQ
jgi:MYXO-CTERM domain-containing protein